MKGKILRGAAFMVFDLNEPMARSISANQEHAKRAMCQYTGLTWTQLVETGCRVAEVEIWEKVESKKKGGKE